MNKKTIIIGILFLLLISACSKSEEQHKFDEEMLIDLSLELVVEANTANSQPIYDLFDETYRRLASLEAINDFIAFQLSKATNYDSIIKTTFSQSVHPLDKYPIATVVVLARFENGTMTYTFNYNELNEIIGFSMNFLLK